MQIIQQVFTAYGVRTAVVVLATVLAVNLIKKPIYKKAESLLTARGIDKSVVTRYATLLPVPIALILDLIFELIEVRGAFSAIDIAELLTRAVVNGGLAVAVYESVKKQLQAYAAKNAAPSVTPEVTDGAEMPTETPEVTDGKEPTESTATDGTDGTDNTTA